MRQLTKEQIMFVDAVLTLLFLVVGVVCLVYGTFLVYWPAGFIVLGIVLLYVATNGVIFKRASK